MKTRIITLTLFLLLVANLRAQNPYIGEIKMFAGNFAPAGWAFCDGQILSISEYETLFNLIGTTYGGDGQNTFAVPDLRGRAPIHLSSAYQIGEQSGEENVTLIGNNIPQHTHTPTLSLPVNSGSANENTPTNNVLSVNASRENDYSTTTNTTMGSVSYTVSPNSTFIGGSQPHNNMKPYLAINYIISLFGIYPPQN